MIAICHRPLFFLLLVFVMAIAPTGVMAACDGSAGRFISIAGVVDVQAPDADGWTSAKLDTRLCLGAAIRVGERSRANVALANDAVLTIDQRTTIRLIDTSPAAQETSVIDLIFGAFQSFSRKPKLLRVYTPDVNGFVEGTEFVIRSDENGTTITMLEGQLLAANAHGEIRIQRGESAQVSQGRAPQREIVLNPREQVQWALFFPPLLTAQAVGMRSPDLGAAANCAANGNIACALNELERVPADQRGPDHLLLRASVLLAVGRVDEAGTVIFDALEAEPDNSAALALRAIIGVAENDEAAALVDARRAVEIDPGLSAARIALSYALQANRDVVGARDTLLTASERNPNNALVWARLAETQLMLGERRASRAAAERAVAINPDLGRTQSVFGFAALAEIDTAAAQAAFEQAIVLDSSDPMPHLGLGLTKIRNGRLNEGRADLEAAVALGSSNALNRTYLARAYLEEKRPPLDEVQLDIATELDPLDPTAYLFDAFRLQTANQPVRAVKRYQESIARNDNRAVFRGGLLLDQDRAARQANLASAYNQLGFRQTAENLASESLSTDPANSAAHRFLSDSYRPQRRREISRVSELFQAQMLQDTNMNPIQPSTSEAKLNTVTSGGPAGVGFNEFTALFERNGAQLNLSGSAGSNNTTSGEAVLSGIYDNVSLSAGTYSYETDGWRPNNQLDQDIQNLFAQVAINPAVNVQFEYRKRESSEGDLAFNFDPDSFNPNKTVERALETARFGLRISPSTSSDILFSYIDSDRDEIQAEPDLPFLDFNSTNRVDGDQTELQYIGRGERYNVIAGMAYADLQLQEDIGGFIFIPDPFFPFLIDLTENSVGQSEHTRGYVYSNIEVSDSVVATVGLALEDYERQINNLTLAQMPTLTKTRANPKLGVQWQATEALKFRAAAFQVTKPDLVANRTLEPTHVAGFNQFFDDVTATVSTRVGGGFDWMPTADITVGGELTGRDLDEPVLATDAFTGDQSFQIEDRDERTHRLYLNLTPTERLSTTAEIVYDRYSSEFTGSDLPEYVRTVSLPVGVRYFDPSGFFGGFGATYVDQKVERAASSTLASGSDSFVVVDLALGFRIPNQLGILSIEVKNAFDESFRYQDDSYRGVSDEPTIGPYFPERTILGQVILNFR